MRSKAWFLVVWGFLFSCGEDSSSSGGSPPVTRELIQGSWTSGCFERNNAKIITSLTYKDLTYETQSRVFSLAGTCAEEELALTVKETGTYSLGSDTGSGNTEIDYTATSIMLTPLTEAGLATVNAACSVVEGSEFNAQTINEESDIINDSCRAVLQIPPFGLVKIVGTALFTGNAQSVAGQEGISKETRPREVAAALPFNK